jgi:alkylhydroperoxidase family enzyme
VLHDAATAPIDERVRAALVLIEVLTLRPDELRADDLDRARSAGLDDAAMRDAAMVCSMFSIITRLADTLCFAIPESFDGSVKVLTGKAGYRMPPPVLRLPRV